MHGEGDHQSRWLTDSATKSRRDNILHDGPKASCLALVCQVCGAIVEQDLHHHRHASVSCICVNLQKNEQGFGTCSCCCMKLLTRESSKKIYTWNEKGSRTALNPKSFCRQTTVAKS